MPNGSDSNAIQGPFFQPMTRTIMMFPSAFPYVTTTQFIVALAGFIVIYGIYKILAFVYDELTSPFRHVPGPPNASFLYGNFKQLSESVSRRAHIVSLLKWIHSE